MTSSWKSESNQKKTLLLVSIRLDKKTFGKLIKMEDKRMFWTDEKNRVGYIPLCKFGYHFSFKHNFFLLDHIRCYEYMLEGRFGVSNDTNHESSMYTMMHNKFWNAPRKSKKIDFLLWVKVGGTTSSKQKMLKLNTKFEYFHVIYIFGPATSGNKQNSYIALKLAHCIFFSF